MFLSPLFVSASIWLAQRDAWSDLLLKALVAWLLLLKAFVVWLPVLLVGLVAGLVTYGLLKWMTPIWNRRWRARREIKSAIGLMEVKQCLAEQGFRLKYEEDGRLVFKRDGTLWTTKGEKLPLQMTIVSNDGQLGLILDYDAFVLYENGDLGRLADRLVAQLSEPTKDSSL